MKDVWPDDGEVLMDVFSEEWADEIVDKYGLITYRRVEGTGSYTGWWQDLPTLRTSGDRLLQVADLQEYQRLQNLIAQVKRARPGIEFWTLIGPDTRRGVRAEDAEAKALEALGLSIEEAIEMLETAGVKRR